MSLIPVSWEPRDAPLSPCAAAARGGVARALSERLLHLDDGPLARLRGVAGRGVIVVLGDAEDLPWVDGVAYLGRDSEAPALLLPTHSRPGVGAALLERALRAQLKGAAPPLAVLVGPEQIVPCAAAMTLARASIERWLAEHR